MDEFTGPACRECGDPQSQHKGGKGGCRHCELGCARYEPEFAAGGVITGPGDGPVMLESPAPYVAPRAPEIVIPAAMVKGRLTDALKSHLTAPTHLERLTADLARVEQERDSLLAHNTELVNVAHERDDARGALSLARSELERLAGELARRSGVLAATQKELVDVAQELGEALAELAARPTEEDWAAAQKDLTDLREQLASAAQVLHSYDAWQCLAGPRPCGRRYTRAEAADNHACGPMTAVTVTITTREGVTPS
ncbi:hypothetical protein OHA21_43705 [Actinoplanes sp. NBC_00393]|uniref:hypothetical protein n=1 Tax=Actinoplanes sp. NBC_00393 TaxID=2975953 RepID=UPI002E1ECACD